MTLLDEQDPGATVPPFTVAPAAPGSSTTSPCSPGARPLHIPNGAMNRITHRLSERETTALWLGYWLGKIDDRLMQDRPTRDAPKYAITEAGRLSEGVAEIVASVLGDVA